MSQRQAGRQGQTSETTEERCRLCLRLLVEVLPVAIVLVDERGRISLANTQAGKIFGYARQNLVGLEMEKLVPERFRSRHAGFVGEFFHGPEARLMGAGRDLCGLRKDGVEIPIEIGLVPFKTDDGTFVLASIIDISERKRAEQSKEESLSTVSHEIRTPLAVAKEGVSQLLEGVAGSAGEGQRRTLEIVWNNMERLGGIIDNLLSYAKLQAGRMSLRKTRCHLVALCRRIAENFQLAAEKKGLELKVRLPSAEMEVYADSDAIAEVLTNLIGNALKFTEKGSIEVSLREKEGRIACSVCDTGKGIAAADLPKLFRRFEQVGRPAISEGKGTGLGLAIAKQLMDLHDGTLAVESKLGEGTTFTFTLPKYTPEMALQEATRNRIEQVQASNSPLSLLLVVFSQGQARLPKDSSPNETRILQERLERAFKESLCRKSDDVLRTSDGVAILLAACDEGDARQVKARCEQILQEISAKEGLLQALKPRLGFAVYPGQAQTHRDLIRKARESLG